jgi:hypothetical protein
LVAIDGDDEAALAVVGEERLGLGGVDGEALRDRLGRVVFPLHEVAPAAVAAGGASRRVEREVVDGAATGADAAPAEALDQHRRGDVDPHDRRDLFTPVGEGPVEGLRLGAGARETVEEGAAHAGAQRPAPPPPRRAALRRAGPWFRLARVRRGRRSL